MSKPMDYRKARLVAALVALAFAWQGSGPARADAAKNPSSVTVIRYLASHGNVTSYELAAALGWLKAKDIKIDSVGSSQAARKVSRRWRRAR